MPTAKTMVPPTTADETTELTEQWLELARIGQRAATETVRRFVETVEEAVPLPGEGLFRQRAIVDGALEMTERLLHAQYNFMRHLVHSAVDVDVGVNVGVNVDVLSQGVNVDVDLLSRESKT
jgi:hypothetical protein